MIASQAHWFLLHSKTLFFLFFNVEVDSDLVLHCTCWQWKWICTYQLFHHWSCSKTGNWSKLSGFARQRYLSKSLRACTCVAVKSLEGCWLWRLVSVASAVFFPLKFLANHSHEPWCLGRITCNWLDDVTWTGFEVMKALSEQRGLRRASQNVWKIKAKDVWLITAISQVFRVNAICRWSICWDFVELELA